VSKGQNLKKQDHYAVSIAKVILQAQDIFRGKLPMIIPSFFTATAYLAFVIFPVSHSVTQAILLQLPHPL